MVPQAIADPLQSFLETLDVPLTFITANGKKKSQQQLHLAWPQMGDSGVAIVLPDTPCVLSVGRWVIDKGWHFEWPACMPYSPFFIRPDGEIIYLVVKGYVPELPDIIDQHASYYWNEYEPALAAIRRRIRGKRPRNEDDPEGGWRDQLPEIPADGPVPPPPEPPAGAEPRFRGD